MNKEKITNEELARMISKGFDGVQEQFRSLRFELKADIADVDRRVSRVEDRVKNIEENMVTRLEFDDHLSRTKLIETKLGIESGK